MACLLCGRKLKSRKSQENGYGPVCYRKLFGSSKRQHIRDRSSGEGIPYYDIPGQIGIEEYLKSLENEK